MARMVALCRCTCGTRVKVVADADSASSATQAASCPTCREPCPIYADKIISITVDTSDFSPAPVRCE